MAWNVSIFFFMILPVVSAYNLTCPVGGQWGLRAKKFCGTTERYTCLLDTVEETYLESCKGRRYEIEGFKTTFNKGNFDRVVCSKERYQPVTFSTDVSSECMLQKSQCTNEGQISYSQDSESTQSDKVCICDYENGYALNVKSKNKCFCIPSEEDCSCYKKRCTTDGQLTPHYECVRKVQSDLYNSNCKKIMRIGIDEKLNNLKDLKKMEDGYYISNHEDFSVFRRSASTMLAVMLVLMMATTTTTIVTFYMKIYREKAKDNNNATKVKRDLEMVVEVRENAVKIPRDTKDDEEGDDNESYKSAVEVIVPEQNQLTTSTQFITSAIDGEESFNNETIQRNESQNQQQTNSQDDIQSEINSEETNDGKCYTTESENREHGKELQDSNFFHDEKNENVAEISKNSKDDFEIEMNKSKESLKKSSEDLKPLVQCSSCLNHEPQTDCENGQQDDNICDEITTQNGNDSNDYVPEEIEEAFQDTNRSEKNSK